MLPVRQTEALERISWMGRQAFPAGKARRQMAGEEWPKALPAPLAWKVAGKQKGMIRRELLNQALVKALTVPALKYLLKG